MHELHSVTHKKTSVIWRFVPDMYQMLQLLKLVYAEAELQSSPHFLCDYHRGDDHMFHFEHHLTRIWNTSTHHGNNGEHEFQCFRECAHT